MKQYITEKEDGNKLTSESLLELTSSKSDLSIKLPGRKEERTWREEKGIKERKWECSSIIQNVVKNEMKNIFNKIASHTAVQANRGISSTFSHRAAASAFVFIEWPTVQGDYSAGCRDKLLDKG